MTAATVQALQAIAEDGLIRGDIDQHAIAWLLNWADKIDGPDADLVDEQISDLHRKFWNRLGVSE